MTAKGESEMLEFKASTGMRNEAAKTVCAMLNQRGGYVLFGIKPECQVAGQQVSDRTLEQLSAEIMRIEPPAFPEVSRIPVSGSLEIISVKVAPGASQPYQYRGNSYLRVGNTTRKMTSEQQNQLLLERMHDEQRWENRPAKDWTLDDLDTAEIRKTVTEAVQNGRLAEPGGRNAEDLLRGLGLIRGGNILRAAAVLFGKAEFLETVMPQCLLRVARFRGTDRSEFLDNRQFIGNAFALLESGMRFLRDTIPIASHFESGRMERIDKPLYPPLAVREALANALCHRDYAMGGGSIGLAIYDDRLEITSVGPLHFGIAPNDLFKPHESRPWNPIIARVFYTRGIIEAWGRGTIKIAELAISAGLPHPEIEGHHDYVTVRFWNPEYTQPHYQDHDLTEQQRAVFAILKQSDDAMALRHIRMALGSQTDERRLRKDLIALKGKGLVILSGKGRGAVWKTI
ncbi:MAG: putative DNA binding domain-containing protein [Gammaproteobacteria bacterium]|nr:putative DNA binding domain-containing protein [Gammaproteobacteria bacterium]